MKTISKLAGIIMAMFTFIQCDPLDKENLAAITGDLVWSTPEIAEAYVNDMYASFMPGFDWTECRDSDEGGVTYDAILISAYIRGTLISNSYDYYPYDDIRRINIFLANIDGATFEESIKNNLKGQALFWRAWAYFKMVRAYGGVPLILEPADPNDDEAVFVPRNKTSECYAQIVKDLDEAIRLLDDKSDVGRIDKCAAMAFKGRVLLFKASPQFNRNNDAAPWQEAYTANKAALDFLDVQGKGLYDDYRNIWLDEMNKEVIMVKRYDYPASPNGSTQAAIRPLAYSRGAYAGNLPTLELVNAYPMKDGSRWDPATMDYRKLHENRDARFYASIAYNGADPFISPMYGRENMWMYWYDNDNDPSTGINGKESRTEHTDSELGVATLFTQTGFYSAKMLDQNITTINVMDGTVDWIEIRYAEVLMNYAEAANETGRTDEALNALYRIRDRAKIEPGDGKYGIKATSTNELRKVIQDERFVEFAFETKRFWDLRRWRIFASTFNNLESKTRHSLRVEYIGDDISKRPRYLTDFNSVWDQFSVTVIPDIEPSNVLPEDKYSFLGLPNSVLDRNSKIEQNNTWEGTFNPLE